MTDLVVRHRDGPKGRSEYTKAGAEEIVTERTERARNRERTDAASKHKGGRSELASGEHRGPTACSRQGGTARELAASGGATERSPSTRDLRTTKHQLPTYV